MIIFHEYESVPITRWAFQITDKHDWVKSAEATYTIAEKTAETTDSIKFKAYEEPKIGDWVVRLTVEDTYHVTDKVFRERNIVA